MNKSHPNHPVYGSRQVSPQHNSGHAKKPKSHKSADNKIAEQEGGAPSLKNNSNDSSLKHMGY